MKVTFAVYFSWLKVVFFNLKVKIIKTMPNILASENVFIHLVKPWEKINKNFQPNLANLWILAERLLKWHQNMLILRYIFMSVHVFHVISLVLVILLSYAWCGSHQKTLPQPLSSLPSSQSLSRSHNHLFGIHCPLPHVCSFTEQVLWAVKAAETNNNE